ncbi:LytR C-terminal domain-containing protein [Embleya sp. AB8]|uniref:LytR C-terminal domain-containing protein n=1 Tax=Embleya sp. AB8 TaxID=3156304 RepID=UPI003C770A2C
MCTRRRDEYDVFAGFGRPGLIWTNEHPWSGEPSIEPAELPAEDELIGGLRADDAPAPARSRRGLIAMAAALALVAVAGAAAIGREGPAARIAADRATRHTPARVPVAAPGAPTRPAPPPARAPALPRGVHGKVTVLDQTKVPVLAKRMARRLEAAGWEVAGTKEFRGTVPETTVYHPADQEPQARALAAALPGITRIKPTFPGIPQRRLTVIVVDDQVIPLADRLLGSVTTR